VIGLVVVDVCLSVKDYLTPLHVAAHCGNVRTAKLLLDSKCQVSPCALVITTFLPLVMIVMKLIMTVITTLMTVICK